MMACLYILTKVKVTQKDVVGTQAEKPVVMQTQEKADRTGEQNIKIPI